MFVPAVNGGYVALSAIVRISYSRDGALNAVTADGETCAVVSFNPDDYGPVIPAAPGFVLLEYASESDDVAKYPVVGWVSCRGQPLPVALDMEYPSARTDHNAVLCPDGRVVDCNGVRFDSEDAWLEDKRSFGAQRAAE